MYEKDKDKRAPVPIDRERYGNSLPMRDLSSIREFPGPQHRERYGDRDRDRDRDRERERERERDRDRDRPADHRERSKDTSVKRSGMYSHSNLLNN